ncbi:hypothetical protein HKD30_08940, partial [Gluconobacter sphaericus]|uniref:transposase n=4 Tax=Gluconobacter sphaericus TaxID=574987 RepID=UPI00188584F1
MKTVRARMLFLPPCSPDFNPIENIFAKMKTWIKRVAPRTLDALQDTTCRTMDDISHFGLYGLKTRGFFESFALRRTRRTPSITLMLAFLRRSWCRIVWLRGQDLNLRP